LIAEGAVIVLSILRAFAVDAWWDSRQDRAREESYLRQLAGDLESTLENNAIFGGRADSIDWAAVRLVQSYYEATPPPPDSVAHWLSLLGFWVVQPRLGTLETLVSTGDLALIRSDSLRTAIPGHLTNMVAFEAFEADGARMYGQAAEELAAHIDRNRIRMEMLSPTARDSILSADPLTPFPRGPMRDIPRQDLQAVVRNPEVHRILARILGAKRFMKVYRDRMRDATEGLLEMVRSAQVG
jgi:hypothetical protein